MPTAMYLMLDRTTNGNEWSSIKTGVEAFANDAGMAGNQLALQYMPPAAGPGSCGGNGYDKPAVPLSVMPSGAGPIAASLAAVNNSGTTQLEGALSGGLDFCTSQAKQLTDHQVVFALLTDYTIFDSCGSTFTLPQIASAALGGSPPVYTWVLGFYLRPRRVLDAAGTSAMSNADLDSARYGLPNSRLGVEPTRRAWTGNAPGVRPDNPMDAVGSPDPAGGVKPATTMPGGAPGGLEDPAGAPKQPAVRSESSDPTPGGGIEPGSQNTGPEPVGSRR